MKIAFLGHGLMGRELAACIITDQTGHDLVVWNRTASAADDLVARALATPTARRPP